MGGDRRILALLTGEDDDDQRVREALARVEPDAVVAVEPDPFLEEVARGGVDVLVCDQRAMDPTRAFERLADVLPERELESILFLALLERGADPDPADPAYAHYLARPFRAETLTALCRALLEESGAPAAGAGSPAVSIRRPARFSARPLYADAIGFARETFARAREDLAPDMGWARLVAERLHTSLVQSNLLLNRALEPYKRFELPTHCVNVAIVAGKIGLGRDLPLEQRLRAIEAGLVHDIGMCRLPDSILYKEDTLTDEERREMERHPVLGAEIVAALGDDFDWLRRAIRQEHERAGGQGYPEGISGDDIDPLAQILGVADVFEAFSHPRAHRSPFTAFEALERITAMRDEFFAGAIVDALANEISVFPLDSYVKLSSGAIGRVIATNPDNLMRPTIEVLWDGSWTPVEPRIVALDRAPEIAIERPLHESEVPIT